MEFDLNFENVDEDVPCELSSIDKCNMQKNIYSSDCQQSVLVYNKGYISPSTKTLFAEEFCNSVKQINFRKERNLSFNYPKDKFSKSTQANLVF